VRGSIVSKPVERWCVLVDAATNTYLPYSDQVNEQLQTQFGGSIKLGNLIISLAEMQELNIESKVTRPIIKGTWFWQANDGSWSPYTKELAEKLEDAFQKRAFIRNINVNTGKRIRQVTQFNDGTFKQFR